MAYGFGTTVNPQLGAVDYSNYLRGALSGAQMEAQGTAAIGQGIQNALGSIGSGIGSGIAMRGERKEKMAERDRLMKQEDAAMQGRVKQANAFAKVMTELDLPEGAKSIFNDFSTGIANNPNVSLAEKSAAADALLSQAPTVISLGLNEAKRRIDVQENKFITDAIAANTEAGTGKIDVQGAYNTAIESGANPEIAAQRLSAITKVSPETFTPGIQTLTDPKTGRQATVVTTSRGGAQVLPEEPGLNIPAQVLVDEAKIKKASEMRKLYEAGKAGEALDIAIGLGIKNGFGQTPTIQDLDLFFKKQEEGGQGGGATPPAQPVSAPTIGRFTVTPQ